jgi:SNF2 family DNA or RNA helicase
MGEFLKRFLEAKYRFEILFFHGGVPEKKRREIVDEFQSKAINSAPILILSLKAGGTGLNLTRGTTVIHFDRWWNPAVENQATDRAYRIGQDSRVNVYKFITVGSLEEKIDSLLEEKKDLADKIVTTSGESWISDLSDDALKELIVLSSNYEMTAE